MIQRPPRSTLDRSSAASDVYKRQQPINIRGFDRDPKGIAPFENVDHVINPDDTDVAPVSYTHLRAHETVLDLVCRLLLEKKNQ